LRAWFTCWRQLAANSMDDVYFVCSKYILVQTSLNKQVQSAIATAQSSEWL
jgi:hypothetical protein